ncbi:5'/3'-nucleotidase SurE [Occultella glacieicola]|uniref:5'-nucleotidase n=1 Tax=Occultella glacieicola TaxID=2518684 RepID=A0ABY2DYL5_9MICO|nr:5'/3'-nucleotidase SurE [Occultella glacieicola]TDE88856.1 5'/3'-nucleotidase SurE [Occultella glacieicola]
MRVLITNDDGIDSPGLVALAHVAADAGHDVIVAAPNRQYSGYSAALSGESEDGGVRRSPGRPEGLREGIESVAVHASPALIAYAAGLGAFGERPDLLLSGVNLGPNVGPAVIHSGTVGAAFSASAQGIPALAASIAAEHPRHWDTAHEVLTRAFEWFTSRPQDARVLNVNIPDVPVAELRGLRAARLATFDVDTDLVNRQIDKLLFRPFAAHDVHFEEDTDAGYLARGWATMSLLRSHFHDADAVDLPAFDTSPEEARR